MLVVHKKKKKKKKKKPNKTTVSKVIFMVLHFFILQATKHLHVSYNNYIKENLCSTEDWKKVTPRDSEFYMASVDTMFSINSQEELSIKSHSHKFSWFY